MKNILVLAALFFSFTAYCQEDYTIHLQDTSFSISLDKQYSIKTKGQNLHFKVTQKDTLTYHDNLYSFQYPKGFKVSSATLSPGIEQISLLNSEGTGLLIQSYGTMSPTSLNEMMLTELTKESISYGYESKKTTYERTLASGQKLHVTKTVLTYKDNVNIYEVASLGQKDAGIMIVTIKMDDNDTSQGQELINWMWRSLKVKW